MKESKDEWGRMHAQMQAGIPPRHKCEGLNTKEEIRERPQIPTSTHSRTHLPAGVTPFPPRDLIPSSCTLSSPPLYAKSVGRLESGQFSTAEVERILRNFTALNRRAMCWARICSRRRHSSTLGLLCVDGRKVGHVRV